MIFIVATTIFFALSFFIIYKLANFIGLKISIKSLFLCAICSVLINLILPLNIKLFNHSNLSIVFLIALFSAYVITYYNERITANQVDPDEEAFLNTDILNELLPIKFKTLFSSKKLLTDNSTNNKNDAIIIENMSLNTLEENTNTKFSDIDEVVEEPVIETEAIDEIIEEPIIESEAIDEVIEEPVIEAEAIDEVIEEPVIEAEAIDEIVEEPIIESEAIDEVVEEPVIETEAIDEIIEEPVIEAEAIDEIVEEPVIETEALQYTLLCDNEEFISHDMDDLIDIANDFKETDPLKSFRALQKALFNNQDNDYAPFIIIEMSNILKAQGLYIDAIEIYQQALSLNIIKNDSYLTQQFSNTINYLTILKNTLLAFNKPQLPFKEISSEILDIVEKEFLEKK